MKIAYFDCFSGISGDMIIGALLDAGLSPKTLESKLEKLNISGYNIKAEKTERNHISGTKFSVEVTDNITERKLQDVIKIIDESDLNTDIKDQSKDIFKKLAQVEAEIHSKDINEIHFHEVGALDSIIDVVGSIICIKEMRIEEIYASKIHVGSGFVETQHGMLPIPAPATAKLLEGLPIFSDEIKAELTTPTGAAIIKSISKSFGKFPQIKTEKIGYGAGERKLQIPNLLRVFIGIKEDQLNEDNVVLIEANIDDMNPEFFDYISETILKNGALDVFMTPIIMKKNRPANKLSVLAKEENLEKITSVIFTETTSLGVRIHHLKRKKLDRKIITAKTKFGNVQVKLGKLKDQIKNIAPEYEDCKRIAKEKNVPIKDVYDEAKSVAQKKLTDK